MELNAAYIYISLLGSENIIKKRKGATPEVLIKRNLRIGTFSLAEDFSKLQFLFFKNSRIIFVRLEESSF